MPKYTILYSVSLVPSLEGQPYAYYNGLELKNSGVISVEGFDAAAAIAKQFHQLGEKIIAERKVD